MTVAEKTCNKCGPRPVAEFGVHRKSPDGLDWSCRACKTAAMKAKRMSDDRFNERQLACVRNYRSSRAGRAATAKYKATPEFKEMRGRLNREYAEREPARVAALNALLVARRSGALRVPARCQCGCGAGGRLRADFDDPRTPFVGLRFLAPKCKGRAIRDRRAAARRGAHLFAASREEHLARFRRVVGEPRPTRSDLMLALAVTGDRAAYDPDWEPDYE